MEKVIKILIAILFLNFIFIPLISCVKIDSNNSSVFIKPEEDLIENYGKESSEITAEMNKEELILPLPQIESDVSLEEALRKRRSIRSFSAKELSLDQISQILWAAQGITQESTGYRTSPSAGALYPLEVFLLKSDGLFHYIPDGHKIIKLSSDDLRPKLLVGVLFQKFITEAPLSIIITAVYERTTAKYGDRGVRYVHMEAGHCCQNILLQTTALGLGAVPVGAFDDTYIQNLLNIPADYMPLYVIPIGYPKESR